MPGKRFLSLFAIGNLSALVGGAVTALASKRHLQASEAERDAMQLRAASLLRIAESIDVYLYTNEHCADGSRRSVFSGPNLEKLMGGSPPEGTDVAREWERLIHPDDFDAHLAHRERLRAGQPSDVRYRLQGYDGINRWINARSRPSRVGDRLFVDGVVSDVTAQVEAEQALAAAQAQLAQMAALSAHQAMHDPLTGLGNRRKLMEDLEAAMAVDQWLLVLLDLDGFKQYNDAYGHPAGDALLCRLSSKLDGALGEHSSSYRLGGDEFCVLTRIDGLDVETALGLLSAALIEEGEGFRVTSSFGTTFLPDECGSATEALQLADQRLYAEKRRRAGGRGQPHDLLAQALYERDPQIQAHMEDVAELSLMVGEQLELEPAALERLKHAALFHDIGKVAVPDNILRKAGPLDDAEWSIVKQHTVIGERILQAAPMLQATAAIVRSTHERIDGQGYPDQLRGDEIPLEARIIAACNAYAAMTSNRPYREAIDPGSALEEISRCAGTQFDPTVVRLLPAIVEALNETRSQ